MAYQSQDHVGVVNLTYTGLLTGNNLSISGNTTLSGGTASGVAYLNGSKVLTTSSALTFDGTTLSNTGSGDRAKFGTGARNIFIAGDSGGVSLFDGAGQTGNGWYISGLSNYVAGYIGSSEQMRLTSTGLGIGTSSPAYKLDVNGQVRVNNDFLISDASAIRGRFYGDATGVLWRAESGLAQRWAIGSTEVMRLDSSGNLGIGTSSPGAKLDVVGAARASNATHKGNIIIQQSSTALAGAGGLELVADASSSGYGARIQSVFNGSSAYDLSFQLRSNSASWTQYMLLDRLGNLGLGVTPSAWVSSSKAIQVSTLISVSQQASGAANFGFNFYEDAANAFKYISTDEACRFSALTDGGFGFFTAPSGTAGNAISFTQAMTLDATARLLVGGTSAVYASNNGALEVQSANGASLNAGRFAANAGGPALTLFKSRNATVGGNTIVVNGDTLGEISFVGANGTGYDVAASIRASVDGTPGASADMPGRLTFFTSADGSATPTERMRLDSSGNLGIGTSSPVNKLVVSNAGAAGFEFDPANGIMQTYNRSGAAYTAAKVYGLTFEVRTGASPAANTFFIDTSGNVGIGTSSPSNTAGFTRQLQIEGPTAALTLFGTTGTGKYTLGVPGLNAFGLWDNTVSAYRLYVDSSGNLGIGTSSPGAKLDVAGANSGSVLASRVLNTSTSANSDAQQFIYVNSGTAGDPYTTWTVGGVTSWSAGIRNSDSDNWYLSPGGSLATSPAVTVTTSGNLGIGTSSPGYKLDVFSAANGIIRVRGGSSINEGGGFFVAKSDNTGSLAAFGDSSRIIGGTPDQAVSIYGNNVPITFYTNAERARISSDGTFRVKGAGTAGSTDAVQFSGSAPADAMRLTSGGGLSVGSTVDAGAGNILVNAGGKLVGNAPTGGTSSTIELYNASTGNMNLLTGFSSAAITFATQSTERARITSTGAWSFGSTGTATGIVGQVLTSSGSGGVPTWSTVSGGINYTRITTNTTLVDKQGVIADTSGGTFTVTLPLTPAVGAQVSVVDGANWGTTNLTIARNGSTIEALAEDLVLDIGGVSVHLVYDGITWNVYTQIGAQGGTAVTLTGTQTLTNKTLTSPVISTISNTGVITLPTSTDTLVGRATTDTLTNKTLQSGVYTSVVDQTGSVRGGVTTVAALNIDCSLGNFFTKTIAANSTFTVSNVPASRAYAFTLEVVHTSGTITWFSGVQWPNNNTAPTLTTGKVHLFTFVTDDGGTTWRGASQINYNS
jgi:hypothetical protein